MTAGSVDVLVQGPRDRAPRRTPRWLVPVLVVVLVAVGGADRVRLQGEASALRGCLRAGQVTVDHTDQRVHAALQYVSPQLGRADTRPELRRSLAQLVRRTAGDGLAPLSRAEQRCAAVPVLPWHRAGVRARQAALAYLAADRTHLVAVAEDLDALGRPDPALTARRDLAVRLVGRLSP